MSVHTPVAEIAGVAESQGVTVARTLGNPAYHLTFDIDGDLDRVRVKRPRANPDRDAFLLKFTKDDQRANIDLFATYRAETVYVIRPDDAPGAKSSMNLTLKSRHEIDHLGRRKQANFASDYTLAEHISRVRNPDS